MRYLLNKLPFMRRLLSKQSLRKKNSDPPELGSLDFKSQGERAIYEHLIRLYDRVSAIEGKQALIVAVGLAILGAIITTAVKVWGS